MKVLLTGRSYLCREGLKQILNELEYEVVCENDNFDLLQELSQQHNPDMIVLEIGARESEILPTIISVKNKFSKSKLLLVCEQGMTSSLFTKIQPKIDCVVNTNVSKEELLLAFHSVVSGEKYFTPSVIKLLLQDSEENNEMVVQQKIFTEREMEIIRYILKGRSNEQIADILFLSEKTVATHKRNIMKKAQVKKTSDLILFALDKGFDRGKHTTL